MSWWDGSQKADTITTRSIGQLMPDKQQFPCVIDTRWHTIAEDGSSPSLLATDYKEPKAFVDASPTLDASYPGKMNNQDVGKLVVEECYPIDMMNVDGRGDEFKAKCYGKDGDAAYSLTRRRPSGVCTPGVIRRYIPLEAERLMGFPRVVTGDVSEMTKDEYIVWLLATHRVEVNCETGEVFSMRTGGGNPCPPRRLKGTVLNGYRVVSLREGDVKKQCRVHRIVWIARHGLVPDGYVVDHINNDKLDNRIENLQLLTPADNSTKAAEDGLYRTGEDNPATKLTDKEVEWIFDAYLSDRGSIRELAEKAGVSKSRVQQIIHMEDWTQIPWRGKPASECPDGPRYKALGNSMCTNVMMWIGERIHEAEKENSDGRQET